MRKGQYHFVKIPRTFPRLHKESMNFNTFPDSKNYFQNFQDFSRFSMSEGTPINSLIISKHVCTISSLLYHNENPAVSDGKRGDGGQASNPEKAETLCSYSNWN